MTPYILMRDARLIELDMLDVCSLCFEDQAFPDYRPLLRKFSDRVGRLADDLEKLAPLEQEVVKNAARWKLLFETPGVRYKEVGLSWIVIQDSGGTSRIIGRGDTLSDAADRALGV